MKSPEEVYESMPNETIIVIVAKIISLFGVQKAVEWLENHAQGK